MRLLPIPTLSPETLKTVAVVVAISVVLVLLLVLFRPAPRYRLKVPLTKAEQRFFWLLAKALPEFYIFPQVSFHAFLDAPQGSDHMRYFAKIAQKRCDYLICDRSFNPLVIVELDDWSHVDPAKDAARDAMPYSAGLDTVRFRGVKGLTQKWVREAVIARMRTPTE